MPKPTCHRRPAHARRLWIAGVLPLAALAAGVVATADQVTLQFLWPKYTPEKVRYGQYLVSSFEESHPNIKINLLLTGNPSQQFGVMAAGGAAPDVGWMGGGWLALADLWLPLDSYVARDGAAFGVSDIFPSLWNTFTVDGHQMAIPSGFTATVLYYNADQFAALGLNTPTNAWTWDEMVQDAKKLTRDQNQDGSPDRWGLYLAQGGDPWPELYYGGQFWDASGRTATFDNPVRQWALGAVHDLYNVSKVVPNAAELKSLNLSNQDLFYNNAVGMYAGGSWMLEPARASAKFNWDIVPFPKATVDGKSVQGTGLWTEEFYVSRTTKHPEEAWEFIKWVTGKKITAWAASAGHIVPARSSVGLSNDFLTASAKPENMQAFLESAQFGVPYGLHKDWTKISNTILPIINKTIYEPQNPLSPANGAQEVQRVLQAELNDYWSHQGASAK